MHKYEFTHGGYRIIPFEVRLPNDGRYYGRAQFRLFDSVGPVLLSINFVEAEFDTAAEAREHAKRRAIEMIDAGDLERSARGDDKGNG